jgi:hypothetical protein
VAIDEGVVVVVEMLTGRGVVVVADAEAEALVVVVLVVVVVATRIQHFTPRLRPRAPSTSIELVIPGLVMY